MSASYEAKRRKRIAEKDARVLQAERELGLSYEIWGVRGCSGTGDPGVLARWRTEEYELLRGGDGSLSVRDRDCMVTVRMYAPGSWSRMQLVSRVGPDIPSWQVFVP
jgi:hypothetical protein